MINYCKADDNNNNINELVADDDDPTVDLQTPSFSLNSDNLSEADARTCDAHDDGAKELPPKVTVLDLEFDQLQYDIQQLHGRWGRAQSLQAELDTIRVQRDDEMRMLRFELGEAQNTVVQTDDMNNQLASGLIDARTFKEELERVPGEVEERSAVCNDGLQKEAIKLNRKAENLEQMLTTKSEAISLLLGETTKLISTRPSTGLREYLSARSMIRYFASLCSKTDWPWAEPRTMTSSLRQPMSTGAMLSFKLMASRRELSTGIAKMASRSIPIRC